MKSIGLFFLLLTLAGAPLVAVGVIYKLRMGHLTHAVLLLAASAGWIVLYLLLLLAASAASRERVLEPGARKSFCGFYLDCHLGASVTGVERRAAIGPLRPQGVFHVVAVHVDSDALAARLDFIHPGAVVRDARGRRYCRHLAAEEALERAEGRPVPFERTLGPNGEGAYTKRLVFDLPEHAERPRLLLTMGHPLERLAELFLIGDEDSFLHRKTVFRL